MSVDNRCEVCGRTKPRPCVNTLTRKDKLGDITPDTPLPGRTEHYARAMPPNPKKDT